ncbi:MAG TPA: response regulator [Geobacteraceae bacterium]|nr:response regulator [Geobacteraceae bacterium]
MKCLIIDDDEFNRDFVATLLGDVAECDEAANSEEGVAGFTEALQSDAPYDLIFQDIMMPGINGHETAKTIRSIEKAKGIQAGKGVRIVMLTALNSPQDAMESFCAFQSAAYVVKPVSKEKLLDVISTLGLLKK